MSKRNRPMRRYQSSDIGPHVYRPVVGHPKPEKGYCDRCLGTVRNDFCKEPVK